MSLLKKIFKKKEDEVQISNSGQPKSGMSEIKIEIPKKESSKKKLFKSKEDKHREKLLQDYQEGKVLKFEDPKKLPPEIKKEEPKYHHHHHKRHNHSHKKFHKKGRY